MSYEILLCSHELSAVGQHVQSFFKANCVDASSDLSAAIAEKKYRAIVLDCGTNDCDVMDCSSQCLEVGRKADLPVIVIANAFSLAEKLKAYEQGCDDIIETATNKDEVCARITKSIFHRIANEQLSQRLEAATETARNAMVDNSDLGANIQFMLAVNQCDNLDQLGQQLFSTLERYGLKCSLQIRSTIEVKNMEAHGMSKDLESQLLLQMKDAGRYIDFGCRTICNYDRVSLLIKNMPLNDSEKYGIIKDNTFSLLQGMNARIHSLEDRYTLIAEREHLRKLSSDVNSVMLTIKDRYQDVMRGIMDEVELSTVLLQDRVPHLALTEADEAFIDSVVERLIQSTGRVFNEGLKVDEVFMRLERSLDRSLQALEVNNSQLSGSRQTPPISDNSVDLF